MGLPINQESESLINTPQFQSIIWTLNNLKPDYLYNDKKAYRFWPTFQMLRSLYNKEIKTRGQEKQTFYFNQQLVLILKKERKKNTFMEVDVGKQIEL